MRMSLILAVLLALPGGTDVLAAPAPETPPAKPKEEISPVEIDFAPVPREVRDGEFKIHIVAETEAGAKFKETYTCQYGFPGDGVRGLVRATFKEAGWTVQGVGETKLIVVGRREARLKSLELKPEGLTMEQTPTVKRLSAKEKW